MKKIILTTISILSVIVMGVVIVACSTDTNNPDIHPKKLVQYASHEQGSEDDWASLYIALDSLNTSYISSTNNNARTNQYIDPDLTEFKYDSLVCHDVSGALRGIEITRTLSIGNIQIAIPGIVIMGAVRSYLAFRKAGESQLITIRNIKSITDLTHTHACVQIGKEHNQLLAAMLNSHFDPTGKTDSQITQAFIQKYQQLYSIVPPYDIINALLNPENIDMERQAAMSVNVRNAYLQFRHTVLPMNISTMHSYITEYLNIVNTAQINEYDKLQMSAYAGVAYYSNALWMIE